MAAQKIALIEHDDMVYSSFTTKAVRRFFSDHRVSSGVNKNNSFENSMRFIFQLVAMIDKLRKA